MKLTKNIIALQKGFLCPTDDGQYNKNMVATVQSNLMTYGYMLDQTAFDAMVMSNASFIENFNNEVISYLNNLMGGSMNYKPLYKNFPQEVMSKSDVELYINALLHYWSMGHWEPSTVQYERPIKLENIKYNMLSFASDEAFNKIFTDLVSINQSLTPMDLNVVRWFVENSSINGVKLNFPESIPFKENLCTLAAMGVENLPIKTTTDVLRVIVHLSGGDISLPKVPPKQISVNTWRKREKIDNPLRNDFKFKKFSRPERRYILSLLENSNCDVREMVLRKERWIRVGEILHPNEYVKQFPKAYNAFLRLRNTKVKSWYSTLEKAFKEHLENGLVFLSSRSGEFMRRLDWLIRRYPDNTDVIMMYFVQSLENTSNKVLYEVYTHFEGRNETKTRSIMIKGTRKRVILPNLEPLSKDIIEKVQTNIKNELRNRFSKLGNMGLCYVDEELKKIPLPTNMRSLNLSAKPLIRGQRTPIDNKEAKVIRPFVHWFDKVGNEDLDLSVTFIGKEKTANVAYFDLRLGNSIHSGDVRHREGACAEYVDIDIKDAINSGFNYAVVDVRNFNGRSLSSVEATFGIMEREYPEANNIWLPETINNCQTLESEATNTLICIIDLETKEYIMLDVDTDSLPVALFDKKNISTIVEYYSKPPKFSFYDLIMLHVDGRGGKLSKTDDDNVDTYFMLKDYVTSYEKIAQMMGV